MRVGWAANLLELDDQGMRCAANWLRRHGFGGIAPTRLLAARLALRRRSWAAMVSVVVVIGAVIMTGTVTIAAAMKGRSAEPALVEETVRTVGLFVFVVVGLLVRWLWQHVLRLGECRVGGALTRRVAHPVASRWPTVVGRLSTVVGAVMFGAALAIGVAGAALSRTAHDRTVAALLVIAIVVVAAMTVFEVAAIVRRPALAEDAVTLAVDDTLRTEDARTVVVSPVPAVLASFTAIFLPPDVSSSLRGFSFALLAFSAVAVLWVEAISPQLRVRASGRQTPPAPS